MPIPVAWDRSTPEVTLPFDSLVPILWVGQSVSYRSKVLRHFCFAWIFPCGRPNIWGFWKEVSQTKFISYQTLKFLNYTAPFDLVSVKTDCAVWSVHGGGKETTRKVPNRILNVSAERLRRKIDPNSAIFGDIATVINRVNFHVDRRKGLNFTGGARFSYSV